jgi:long-chain acyl-CoA synthetase
MIVIDEENVTNFAQEHRIPFTTFSDLSRKREVYTLIDGEVERVNRTLSQVEMVKRFAVLDKKLDPEDEDITPTMKVKRKAISERYRELIESLYE